MTSKTVANERYIGRDVPDEVAFPESMAQRQAAIVVEYLNSESGRKMLAEYNAELDAIYKKLAATRVIPQELLHAPFTI